MGSVAGLSVVGGVLLREGRLVLPLGSRVLHAVFEAAHDSRLAGHRSWPATLERMLHSVWASGLAGWVRRKVGSCTVCLRGKSDTRRYSPM